MTTQSAPSELTARGTPLMVEDMRRAYDRIMAGPTPEQYAAADRIAEEMRVRFEQLSDDEKARFILDTWPGHP